jgi:hypothetical protein
MMHQWMEIHSQDCDGALICAAKDDRSVLRQQGQHLLDDRLDPKSGGVDADGVIGRSQRRTARWASRASRARISRSRPLNVTETPFSINCL